MTLSMSLYLHLLSCLFTRGGEGLMDNKFHHFSTTVRALEAQGSGEVMVELENLSSLSLSTDHLLS